MELAPIYQQIKDLQLRLNAISKYLEITDKKYRLEEVLRELENPELWNNQEKAQAINKEKSTLEDIINSIEKSQSVLQDAPELLEMSEAENDTAGINASIEMTLIWLKNLSPN
jgi:peptide chain release factor 2